MLFRGELCCNLTKHTLFLVDISICSSFARNRCWQSENPFDTESNEYRLMRLPWCRRGDAFNVACRFPEIIIPAKRWQYFHFPAPPHTQLQIDEGWKRMTLACITTGPDACMASLAMATIEHKRRKLPYQITTDHPPPSNVYRHRRLRQNHRPTDRPTNPTIFMPESLLENFFHGK